MPDAARGGARPAITQSSFAPLSAVGFITPRQPSVSTVGRDTESMSKDREASQPKTCVGSGKLPFAAKMHVFGGYYHPVKWTPELSRGFESLIPMSSRPMPNYLRSNRKRLALSQKDLTFLLGAEDGAKVCRYERFIRNPGLQAALAFEAVFQRPIRELFAGLYQKVEREVANRAKRLAARPDRGKPSRREIRRRETLSAIASMRSDNPN